MAAARKLYEISIFPAVDCLFGATKLSYVVTCLLSFPGLRDHEGMPKVKEVTRGQGLV